MDPDNGSIEHLDIGISFIRYGSEDAVPDACLAPSVEAIVAGRIGAIAVRQITPRRSRPQDPEDAVQHAPVVYPRDTARLVRQNRPNNLPLTVGDFVAHDSKLPRA